MKIFYENREHPLSIVKSSRLVFLPHLHHPVEVVQVHSGTLAMEVTGRALLLRPGDLAVVFPETVHSYQGGRHGLVSLLIYSTELAPDYARAFTAMQPATPHIPAATVHPDVPYALGRLHEEMEGEPDRKLLKSYLSLLSGRLLGQLALVPRPAGQNTDLMSRLLLYLDEHFREPVTLEQLAAELNVSKYHLSHQFSQKMRCTLRHYINTLRVEHAKSLLQSPAMQVTAAGYEAGFESSSTFYREFARHTGMSPRAWREGERQAAPHAGG